MPRKPPKRGVSLLPTYEEAALYFVDPDDMGAAVALNVYKDRTGAEIEEFRAGMRLLWARCQTQELGE